MTMESIELVVERMRGYGDRTALYWKGAEHSYRELFAMVEAWHGELGELGIGAGSVVGVLGEFSPRTCSLFFALMQAGAIIVPFTRAIQPEVPAFMEIAGVEHLITVDEADAWTHEAFANVPQNELIQQFRGGPPGLVVFSSGSTGKPKGILQDCERVMRKFVKERRGWRTVLFLMMDHFGGFNTFLSAFAYGGVGVCVSDRSPGEVCRAIQDGKANLLPTTPTFLNLLIATRAFREFDLSSIELITYGTEVMP
ncbi:MAG: acyl--CoA ligase, partial [Myxococcales bacterium]|nr:acyl--CoA ligase [Myxococcales bacterium]